MQRFMRSLMKDVFYYSKGLHLIYGEHAILRSQDRMCGDRTHYIYLTLNCIIFLLCLWMYVACRDIN